VPETVGTPYDPYSSMISGNCYPHFAEEATEANSPKSLNNSEVKLKLKPKFM
jgi:hypothetical protein